MLTKANLEHILNWAKHLSQDPEYIYTKWDANVALAVQQEIKNISKSYYEKYKSKKSGGGFEIHDRTGEPSLQRIQRTPKQK